MLFRSIEGNETRLKILHSQMQEASENSNGKKIVEISQAIHTCDESINSLFEELEELTHRHEKLSAEFDRQLQDIE